MMRLIQFTVNILLLFAVTACHANPTEKINHYQWPDTLRLENAHVFVEVTPSIGRITGFGPLNGNNLIWLNPDYVKNEIRDDGSIYRNYGGDKIWPTLQAIWKQAFNGKSIWPPDGIIDGSPWNILEQSNKYVVIESKINPLLGVTVRRKISLSHDKPVVEITNTITRVRPSPFPVHSWSVTQVHSPNYVIMDLEEMAYDGPKFTVYHEPKLIRKHSTQINNTAIKWQIMNQDAPLSTAGKKAGTYGKYLTAAWDDWVWVMKSDITSNGAYPEAASIQVFSDGTFTELETLSDFRHLGLSQSLDHTVQWELYPRDERQPEDIINLIENR